MNGQYVSGWYEDEILTDNVAIPDWWNDECHRIVEIPDIRGFKLEKYCLVCRSPIPESGCIHNEYG